MTDRPAPPPPRQPAAPPPHPVQPRQAAHLRQPTQAPRAAGQQRLPGSRIRRNRRNATRRGPAPVYVIVLAGGTAGLIWIWQGGSHGIKGGTLAVAGAMFVAALARLVLPESRAGMLASRKRLTDVITLAALAAGLLAAGLLLPTPL